MSSGLYYHNSGPLFPIAGCLISFYHYRFIEIPVFNANNVDTDSVASDLGLHCLPITILGLQIKVG